MTATIIRIHDYHLRRAQSLEQQANNILGQVLTLTDFAKLGGPPVPDTSPCEMIPYHGDEIVFRDPA